jgi:hypothetical protein
MALAVAPLRWDALDWPTFLAELGSYRDRFLRGGVNDQELAYIRCLKAFQCRSTEQRVTRMSYLLDFLNSWECRLNRVAASAALTEWIRQHATELDSLQELRVFDDEFQAQIASLTGLYEQLMSLRGPALHNWSDACASKTLNQLAPSTFVMWDNKIKVYAAGSYGHFLTAMHELAVRLLGESPAADGVELEAYLGEQLGYKVHKTLAKYLDEYNWHVAVGRGYA